MAVAARGKVQEASRAWVWGSVIIAAAATLAAPILVTKLLFLLAHSWSDQGRAMLFATGSIAGEALVVCLLWFVLHREEGTFKGLGLWKKATWYGWLACLCVAAYSVVPQIEGLANRLHSPIAHFLFAPTFYHIYTACILGLGAGFCEGIVFRGYIMTRLAAGGHGRLIQVLASAVLFGLGHSGYGFSLGWRVGLGIMIPTAVLGGLYAIVYLISRRSLMPCILSHFLNDAIVLPWVLVQIVRTFPR